MNHFMESFYPAGDIVRRRQASQWPLLDPQAQPPQDLLDRVTYRMAGLTDTDIAGLEERLARML